MHRSQIAARTTIFYFAIFLLLGQGDLVHAQEAMAGPIEAAIESIESSGKQTEPLSMVQMYTVAANMHLTDGNHEKAKERIKLALQMCRDQQLDGAAELTVHAAGMVWKKLDPNGAAEFLNEQLNHPNGSKAFKNAVRKVLDVQLMMSGDFVSWVALGKENLDAVQIESPGSIEEAEALLDYGEKCVNSQLIDLAIDPLKQAIALGEKLDRSDISARAALALSRGLVKTNKEEEAAELLTNQIEKIRKSEIHPQLSMLRRILATTQLQLGDFVAAEKTIDDQLRDAEAAGDVLDSCKVLTLKATNIFAIGVADGSLEESLPVVIETLEKVIDLRTKALTYNGQDFSYLMNNPTLISLAAFQAVAGQVDAAIKTLDRTSSSIDTMEATSQDHIKAGALDSDESSVLYADQRAAIAEIRQLLLVRAGKFGEALVVAEQSRGAAQTELLKRRLGIEQTNDASETIDVQQIQDIADSQNTTLVYYSLIYTLDPSTRDFFKKNHTVNSPQSLYIWVVRPQQKIEFVSQDLPVRINALVSMARNEIVAVIDEANVENTYREDESSLATDANIVQLLTRSPHAIAELKSDSDALQQLHQLLIEPIKQWLPKTANEIVTFVPQGNLFVVPFAALADAYDEPLIAKHTISISPSAKLLALADQEHQLVKQTNNHGIVIVGNPTMPSYQERPDKPAVQLSPLPGAEAEANYIAELFDVEAICGDAADERSVVEAMQTAKYIHLATHGLLKPQDTYAQSYLSSLALAPSDDENGFLTVRETMRLNLNAEMAVLSGCDTGRGRISGDGVVGLVRGYLSSGIPTVVVSLWPVNDNSTAILMAIYYKELLAGEGKAVALRTAMLETRRQFTHPQAWGAFTLYGYSR